MESEFVRSLSVSKKVMDGLFTASALFKAATSKDVPGHPAYKQGAKADRNNNADNLGLFVNQTTNEDVDCVTQDEQRSASADAVDKYFTHV